MLRIPLALCLVHLVAAPTGASGHPQPGDAFDAVPFGMPLFESERGLAGVRWSEPRKIRRVVVTWPVGKAPEPAAIRVQYWHGSWDGGPDRVLSETGAGGDGWARMDDWFNGKWQDAKTLLERDGDTWTYRFESSTAEFSKLTGEGVTYRRTLKLRLVGDEGLTARVRMEAQTDSRYAAHTVAINFGTPTEPRFAGKDQLHGTINVLNGFLVASSLATVVPPGNSFEVIPDGGHPLIATLIAAADPTSDTYDVSVVTVNCGPRSFSFSMADALREPILIDDLGVLIAVDKQVADIESYRRRLRESPRRTVYERVFDEPEQTLSRAWDDMPLKRPLLFVHGLPGNRNAMNSLPNGQVAVSNVERWFKLPISAKDSERKRWDGQELTIDFGFPEDRLRGGRELRDGYLPVLRTWWADGDVMYEQSCVLDALSGDLTDIQADDPTVMLVRVRMLNTSGERPATGHVRIESKAQEREALLARYEGPFAFLNAPSRDGDRLRVLVVNPDQLKLDACNGGLNVIADLPRGGSAEFFAYIPSITVDKPEEIAALQERNFIEDRERICAYWQSRTADGARIDTPEPWITDFHKAHLRHMLINCVREVGSDVLHAHVGTFHYGVYPDESAMMISDLDRRGYHEVAEKCLDAYFKYQGTVQMPGNFKTTEGLFYGAGGHESAGYNKSHGWVLWLMAEHWRLTRDRDWMNRHGDQLVAGCDWVTRERLKFDGPAKDRPLETGFLPAGSLEDVTDYWYWLVTNVCTVWGMEHLSAALADAGHPQAGRLQHEAKSFRDDVMRAIEASRVRCPVVQLRDGTWVPKYPSRLYERGRSYGWLRETLEGSIHLLITGMLDPNGTEARWILEDFEDNLYISDRYGYAIPSFDRFWFSRGGFSMQANLLGGPLPYLERDEIKHFLRAYFNSFASAYYPETRMCNEHSLPELGYPAGDHFKSSDEAQSTYWLRLMFVHEAGDTLYLGQAIPRYWLASGRSIGIERSASHFGPLSLRIDAVTTKNTIEARVDPPRRNPPKKMLLRLRHPAEARIRSVTLNDKPWERFDPEKEWIELPVDAPGPLKVVASY